MFWFDEDNDTIYLVKIKDGIKHIQLIQAHVELLSNALKTIHQTTIGKETD